MPPRLAIVDKLNHGLLDIMQRNNWPVTFSIGAVICAGAQYQAEQLLKMADNLMYSIKRERKNAIKYTHCSSL